MASKPKHVLEELFHPGPHEVRRGDLALVGMPGAVFTPVRGLNLPAVVFGHGWVQPPGRYLDLLRHLASWGIVAVAPATQGGPLPSHRLFAADLRKMAEIVTSVRLGQDGISIDPAKLGVAGHSIGGGSATLAAAQEGEPRLRAVATVNATQTIPSATDAAERITAPGMHLTAEEDLVAPALGNARAIANAWQGPVQLRTVPKSSHLGVTEGWHWSQPLLHGKPHRPTQRTARALFTAFFLRHLAGASGYSDLLEAELKKHAKLEFTRGPREDTRRSEKAPAPA